MLRRLDHDQDSDVSFSDFFQRLLPYFVYTTGTGVTQQNQKPYKAAPITRADRLDMLPTDPLDASPSPLYKKQRAKKFNPNKSTNSINHRISIQAAPFTPVITGHLRVRTSD